jgi:flagellar protein FlaG
MIERVQPSHVVTPQNQQQGLFNGNELKNQNQVEVKTKKEQNMLINLTRGTTEELVENLNKFLKPVQTSIQFELHEKLNEYYVKIVDRDTKEVIKEIPPKKLLDIYAAMVEQLGLIVDKKI